jgi:nitrite reductase (NO-forming)
MYHCGTPMVLEHIASGMYGMVVVEPKNGYPTKVDREYAVIQSEFYTKLDPDKRKIDGAPLYVLDGDRVRTKAPTYTVFNGRYNGFIDKPLPAKPGERVRLFVLNIGPRIRRASTSWGRSSIASGSRAIPTTSSAALKPCSSDRATARSSSL